MDSHKMAVNSLQLNEPIVSKMMYAYFMKSNTFQQRFYTKSTCNPIACISSEKKKTKEGVHCTHMEYLCFMVHQLHFIFYHDSNRQYLSINWHTRYSSILLFIFTLFSSSILASQFQLHWLIDRF